MKLYCYVAGLLLLLAFASTPQAQAVRKGSASNEAEQAEKQKAEAEKQKAEAKKAEEAKAAKEAEEGEEVDGTESPWTLEQIKDFVKTGLKITWKHVGPGTGANGKKIQESLTLKVSEIEGDNITLDEDIEDDNKGAGMALEAGWATDFEEARAGIFDLPLELDYKLTTEDTTLRVAGKKYDCVAYVLRLPDAGKYKWWICKDLPGLILRYENWTTVVEKGKATDGCVLEYYEVTALDIPRESIKPSKKKKSKK
ncbi:MAG: hypothetical protein KDB90_09030 [Planctomycetes bacterium]|nr:hypothetical protein [Planctomycetota bacterium]